jgi:hypothetical protein
MRVDGYSHHPNVTLLLSTQLDEEIVKIGSMHLEDIVHPEVTLCFSCESFVCSASQPCSGSHRIR